jgi:hypothetical protein
MELNEFQKRAFETDHHVRDYGTRLTNSYVIRQKDGPYFTELHVGKLRKSIRQLRVSQLENSLHLALDESQDLFAGAAKVDAHLHRFISDICERYKDYTEEKLKTAVYMTTPMRALLRREKYDHENLFNAPIDFSAVRKRSA